MDRYLSGGIVRPVISKRGDRPGRGASRLERCPLCGRSFHVALINSHAAECNGPPAPAASSAPKLAAGDVSVTNSSLATNLDGAGAFGPALGDVSGVAITMTVEAGSQSCTSVPEPPLQKKRNRPVARQQQTSDTLLFPDCAGAPRPSPRLVLPQLENPSLPGQYLIPNFITEAEELELLAFLDCPTTQPPWKASTVGYIPPLLLFSHGLLTALVSVSLCTT